MYRTQGLSACCTASIFTRSTHFVYCEGLPLDRAIENVIHNFSEDIVRCTDLQMLVPHLIEQHLLTKAEEAYLVNEREDHSVRIRRCRLNLFVVRAFVAIQLVTCQGSVREVLPTKIFLQMFPNFSLLLKYMECMHGLLVVMCGNCGGLVSVLVMHAPTCVYACTDDVYVATVPRLVHYI